MEYTPPYPVVLVVWTDASADDDWTNTDDIVDWSTKKLKAGASASFLIHQDEDFITLCAHDHQTQMRHVMKVPRSCIHSIDVIWQANPKQPVSVKSGKQRRGDRRRGGGA